ncbi:MAG: hypothetical protein JXB26_20085 [Candidatus Aminicenantes bacterium]|nr:hypothetical protein [Candidatus Aminicenantes bacterium]
MGNRRLKFFLVLFLAVLLFQPAWAKKGKFEFGFHYGRWSVNIVKGIIEDTIGETFEDSLRDTILDEIQEDHPELQESVYDQEINFYSGGPHMGAELRWYPGGEKGSFSLGLAVEKTTLRLGLRDTTVDMELINETTMEISTFEGTVNSMEMEFKPLSFHLTFRWDIKPSWRIRPYITFGLGVAMISYFENATVGYDFEGTLQIPGEDLESYSDQDSKTVLELKEEADDPDEFYIPPVFPFVQLNIGIKGQLAGGLYILADAGIFDGFLFKGGLSYRF